MYPVHALLRIESLQGKVLSSNRTWSVYPDTLFRAKYINALQREYDFHKQLFESQERRAKPSYGDTISVRITRVRAVPQEENILSGDQGFMAYGSSSRHAGGLGGGGGRDRGGGQGRSYG